MARADVTPTRRTVARGAAWAVPTAVATIAAPAYAARRAGPIPDVSFGSRTAVGATANWFMESGSGDFPLDHPSAQTSRIPGFRDSDPLTGAVSGPWFGVGNEPSRPTALVARRNDLVALGVGCSYCFSFHISTWEGAPAGLTVTAVLGTQTPLSVTTRTGGSQGILSRDLLVTSSPFTVPTAAGQTLEIRLTFPTGVGNSSNANDAYVRSPTLTRC